MAASSVYSALMKLPVVMPQVSNQRWSCHSCGNCCRSLTGHLTQAERRRLDAQNWRTELGVEPYLSLGRGFVLNKTTDDVCVFLDPNNRCRIHAKYGEAAKPIACRIFPFSARPVREGWQISLRFDCPTVADSKGEPIATYKPWLAELVSEIDESSSKSDAVALTGGIIATPREVESLMSHLLGWLNLSNPGETRHHPPLPSGPNGVQGNSELGATPHHPPLARGDKGGSDCHTSLRLAITDRLIGAAHFTTLLAGARLEKVRDERFVELLDILSSSWPEECVVERDEPSAPQSAMLRLLVFAHVEHVTLAEMKSGTWGRTRKKINQLHRARKMRRGRGFAPTLLGFQLPEQPSFDALESVAPAPATDVRVEHLLHRYLSARFTGRTVFGDGYYGWPVFLGLSALWSAVAATGWLARYHAAGHGRNQLEFSDIAAALAVVDRAATRLPSLGTAAERLRQVYLLRNDGVCRLVSRYRWIA